MPRALRDSFVGGIARGRECTAPSAPAPSPCAPLLCAVALPLLPPLAWCSWPRGPPGDALRLAARAGCPCPLACGSRLCRACGRARPPDGDRDSAPASPLPFAAAWLPAARRAACARRMVTRCVTFGLVKAHASLGSMPEPLGPHASHTAGATAMCTRQHNTPFALAQPTAPAAPSCDCVAADTCQVVTRIFSLRSKHKIKTTTMAK